MGWAATTPRTGDDAVPIGIGVGGEGDVEGSLRPIKALYRVWRGLSIRIWPSQSSVMNAKVGSTILCLATVRDYTSAR